MFEDLKDKAEGELADLRKAETNAQHNYDMLKQSLEDQRRPTKRTLRTRRAPKQRQLRRKQRQRATSW